LQQIRLGSAGTGLHPALGVDFDADQAEPGTEVTVLWGDSNTIPRADSEPHRQVSVKAVVAPAPYGQYAREQYRK